MEKALLEKSILERKSTWQIAAENGIGQTTVRYWLRKHHLTTAFIKPYLCKCGEADPKNFYSKQKVQCKNCFNQARIEVFNGTRRKAVNHKGGKCKICSYNKYIGALELHHTNPEEKDPNFTSMRCWSWKRLEKELKKCVLLCSNCHSEVHGGIEKI